MKCKAQATRWYPPHACPNNAKLDGYCYAHHPSVVLAIARVKLAAGEPDRLREVVAEQERLLAEIEMARDGSNSPRIDPPAGRV